MARRAIIAGQYLAAGVSDSGCVKKEMEEKNNTMITL
jgi:hypothetical protein